MPSRRKILAGLGIFGSGFLVGDNALHLRKAAGRLRRKIASSRSEIDKSGLEPSRIPLRETDSKPVGLFDLRSAPLDEVKVGVIGVGTRGGRLVEIAGRTNGARVVAIADLRSSRIDDIHKRFAKLSLPPIKHGFAGGEDVYKALLALDLDLVLIATPWDSHAAMSIEAMEQNKHVGVEVPACVTMDEAWAILDAAERTRKHFMILENVCYGRTELTLLNMVRHGVFGEIVHGRAAYSHDLLESLIGAREHYPPFWRLKQHVRRNGNLYPTHGFGPISKVLGLFETDAVTSITSASSASLSLNARLPDSIESVMQGDTNTSLISTEAGRVITLQYNVATPRPYSRDNTVIGTKGIFEGYPNRLSLLPEAHRYHPELWSAAQLRYESALWQEAEFSEDMARPHGGMDWLMISRLIDNLRKGNAMDINVYESVLWSALGPLSETSVARGGEPVEIPDFSRGKWRERGGEQSLPQLWGVREV